MRSVTINEAMELVKQLNNRQVELVSLRNTNSAERTSHYGANADKMQTIKPTYDARKLDSLVNRIAKEIRVLSLAIKATNQATAVVGYHFDEAVFGELE